MITYLTGAGLTAFAIMATAGSVAFPVTAAAANAQIPIVLLHPFTARRYRCSEHHESELPYPGDALGTDCAIERDGRTFAGEGKRNEDYFGWNEPVLAPSSGIVEKVIVNPVVNVPGTLGKPPAASVIIRRNDAVKVIVGHLQGIVVQEGQRIVGGQVIGRVGNNGMSTSPHLHIAAWKGGAPYQVRWDLRALGRLRGAPAVQRRP